MFKLTYSDTQVTQKTSWNKNDVNKFWVGYTNHSCCMYIEYIRHFVYISEYMHLTLCAHFDNLSNFLESETQSLIN